MLLASAQASTLATGIVLTEVAGGEVALAMVFMLPETVGFRDKLGAALGPESATTKYFQIIVEEVEHYLELKTIVSVATGLLIGVWVALLGVPFPLLWGLVGFLFN